MRLIPMSISETMLNMFYPPEPSALGSPKPSEACGRGTKSSTIFSTRRTA